MAVGDIIANRFAIEHLAGRGGMGEVYRGRDLETGDAVAVKVLRRPHGGDAGRFEREATILSSVRDVRIVRHVAHGYTPSGEPYLAMEWLDGLDLAAVLARGPLGVAAAVELCAEVAEALGVLHECGIVHRDLKPSNVFLPGGRVEHIKLLDFGIAHVDASTRMTQTGALVGTAGYMAPEQAKGASSVGPPADIFALGCLLFECLAGEAAFQGNQVMALLAKILFDETPRLSDRCVHVPAPLQELLARMLSKTPSERPEHGKAAAEVLRALGTLPEGPLARKSERAPVKTLTDSELRAVAMILMGPPRSGALALSATDEWLAALARDYDASVERLLDGSVAVLLSSTRVATDLAAQAALCALAMRRQAPDRPIGLAMGRSQSSSTHPLGPAIDHAAQVLAAMDASHTPVPSPAVGVDDTAARLLDARFEIRTTGGVHLLRGERELVETRTLLGKTTPCVGRERELRALEGLFADCVGDGGGAQIALLTGPPGAGKSRIAREFLYKVREGGRPVSVWAARCEPIRAGSALGLLAGLVRSATGIRGGELPPERQAKLAERVRECIPAEEQGFVAMFLGELVGAPCGGDQSVILRAARQDPQLMHEHICEAFQRFVTAECKAHPVLAIVEDLHWGDAPTVRALDEALALLEDRPFFLLAAARPEVHQAFPDLWAQRVVTEVRLRELPPKAAERLLRHALGDDATPELVEHIVRLAEGNAFYLEELIRAAAEGNRRDLPETVVAMVQSRISSLADEERRLLRAASIFGETCWQGGVAALLGEPNDIASRLRALADKELLTLRPKSRFPNEPEYAFRHALLREGAYSMLTEEDRALGHRLAGDWLDRHREEDPIVLAEHFEKGGERKRAGDLYLRAAERAFLGGDTIATHSCISRGLACSTSDDLRRRLLGLSCQAHYHRVETLEQALPAAAELLQSAERGSAPWAQAMLVKLTSAVIAGRMDEFGEVSQAAMATAYTPDAYDPASLTLATICYLFELGGHMDAAKVAFGRLEAIARARDATAWSATALYYLYDALHRAYVSDDPSAGKEQARAALELARSIGHRKYATMAELFGALNAWFLGALDEARAAAEAVHASADESGFASATRPFMLAWLLADQGHLTEARAWAERLVEQGATRSLPLDRARGQWVLAEVLRRAGQLEEADIELSAGLALLRGVCPLDVPGALASLSRLRLAQSRPEEALAAAREGFELASSLGACSQFFRTGFLRLAFAESLHAAGNTTQARGAIREARDWVYSVTAKMSSSAERARFLRGVPDNASILALAEAWVGALHPPEPPEGEHPLPERPCGAPPEPRPDLARSDGELFAAWTGGDRDAGAALIERHYDALDRFFSTKASDHTGDLVQQTLLACAEAAHRFRGDGSFRGFLFGIARNILCEHIRRRARDGRSSPDFTMSAVADLLPGVATQVSQRAEHRQLVWALQRIPVDLQIIIELYYWEDLSIDELSQVVEVPPGTIKSRLHRARTLLREALDNVPGSFEEVESARTLLQRWIEDVRDRAPRKDSD